MDLTVVDNLPKIYNHSRLPQPYLRIDLASDFDLVADTNGNIYTFKVGCGTFGDEERMIFGPMAAGDPPLDLLDAEPAMLRDASGSARYVLFVPVSAPTMASTSANAEREAYDLETDADDLCVMIKQMGYFVTESSSKTIQISQSDIAEALAR